MKIKEFKRKLIRKWWRNGWSRLEKKIIIQLNQRSCETSQSHRRMKIWIWAWTRETNFWIFAAFTKTIILFQHLLLQTLSWTKYKMPQSGSYDGDSSNLLGSVVIQYYYYVVPCNVWCLLTTLLAALLVCGLAGRICFCIVMFCQY